MAWFTRRRREEVIQNPRASGGSGFTLPFGIAYTRHRQPDPGIAANSYDTLALPLYTPIGWGVQNKRQWQSAPSNTVVYQEQAIALTTIGNPGNLSGTFVSGPLIDTQSNAGNVQAYAIPEPGSFMLPVRMS